MTSRLLFILLFLAFLVLLEWYAFGALRSATANLSATARRAWAIVYWSFTGLAVLSALALAVASANLSQGVRSLLINVMFVNLLSKIFVALFLVLADLVRLGKWTFNGFKGNNSTPEQPTGEPITRSEFLTKAALVAGAVPAVAMTFGILSGAHDYRVRRVTVRLPNLPKSFDGLRLAQISDIHSGSFFNKTAVKGGVEMLLREKPDLVFFTGDLVNNVATEVQDYISIFNKVKAPLGVYSTLGNHDYGDYVSWVTPQAKRQNLQDLMTAHKLLGWDLLMNENRKLKRGGDEIAIVGIENWGGKGRFPKYGRLDLANKNTQDSAVKLLLSHDPSHWRAQVLEEYPDIDVMFAGHTHGMQFGVELGNVKWSPVKYMYPEWAGLYSEGNQHLYVNRGYGYIGYPGRIGILPEITIMEFKTAV